MSALEKYLASEKTLAGKHVLVTAGPTYERIDPVRFIGNFSTGKMGYAVAEEAAARGARVTLVSGPVSLSAVHPSIHVVLLETDNEHANAVEKMERKHLDMIVMNSLRDEGAGFGTDTNKVTIYCAGGKKREFSLKSKAEVAADILNIIEECVARQA